MKKNAFLTYSACCILAATFSACSSDELDSMTQGAYNGNVINLTSALEQTRTVSDPQNNALSTSNSVGVFVINGNTTITNGDNNKHSVGTSGELTTSSTMNYPSEDGATVNIYAYAPYKSGVTLSADNNFSVSADQSTESGYLASDLLYASKTGQASTENAVSLNFTHKLSQLQIVIQNDADVDLSKATVSISGTKVATTFNPSTGAMGAATGEATDIKVASITAAATVYGVVVPQEIAAGTELVKIVAAGKQYVAKLTSAATLTGSKAYKFTVKLSSSEEPVVTVPITLGSTSITEWGTPENLGEATMEETEVEPITLTATFGTPGGNASYTAPTYTWTAGNNNLMTVFEFANGELADYQTLTFTISNLTSGAGVRMGYYVGSTFTEFGNGYYSAGEKTVDLTALGIDLSTVTKIAFGGKSGDGGSCDIVATDVKLIGSPDAGSSTDDSKLYATFGTPGGNAAFASDTYSWTGSTNNLMSCFTFDNGELANYTTLNFTFSELSDGASVRINVLFSDNTNKSKSYYSAGTKATSISELLDDTHTAADVTAIRFGGNSNSGSCVIKASDMYLE